MSKLDSMNGFRGGVVYSAAGVLPATVHTWPIEVGKARPAAHKRYDAFDAIILSIMRVLTAEAGLPAARAAHVLNEQRHAIVDAVTAIVDEQEEAQRWRWDGGPYLCIRPASSRASGTADVAHIIDDDQLAATIGDRSSGMAQIIVPLPRNVCRTLLSLENVLSGNKPATRDE